MKTKCRTVWRSSLTGLFLAATLTANAGPPPVQGQYRVIDLGRLGGFRSEARGINEAGNIAGLSTSDIGYQAVRWRWDETNYVIDALGKGEAYSIADDNTVVGLGDSVEGGTVWPPYGAPVHLGLDKRFNAIAVASGIPVGWINTTLTNPSPPFNVKFPKHAASFSGASATDLTQRDEWDCAVAGVDRTGSRKVGSLFTNVFALSGVVHAWLFPGRDLHDWTDFANSYALAVNNSGQVVGYANSINTGPFNQPMFWSESTGMRLLKAPGGSPYGSALGMNDRGQAVGALGSSAVLWVNIGQPDETNVFLNSLPPAGHGWNLQAAYAINNRGEIVGYGLGPEGYVHGFCLVPTNIANKVIVLRALEVNQAVQDWENTVPLVQARRTLVRAHLELFVTNTDPVLVRGAHLLVRRGTDTIDLTPVNAPNGLMVTNRDAQTVRTNLDLSLNFELPPAWRNGNNVTLQFLWPNGKVVNHEPADASGDPGGNGIVRVSFTPVSPLQVKWLFMQWTDTNGVTHGPATGKAGELTARLLSIYPVSKIVTAPVVTYLWTNNPPVATSNQSSALLEGLLNDVQSLRERQVGTNSRVHYYSVVTDVGLGGLGFFASNPADFKSASAAGSLPDDPWRYGRNRHAHEIGHNLGREHAVSRLTAMETRGDWGETGSTNAPIFPFLAVNSDVPPKKIPTLSPLFDGTNKLAYGWDSHAGIVVDPFKKFELMGYADKSTWRWISTYTYTNIMNAIIARFGGVSPASGGGLFTTNLLVRGLIDANDVVEFKPFHLLITDDPPQVDPGDYDLLVLSNETVLWETSFAPVPMHPDSDFPAEDSNTVSRFSIPVPILPGADAVVVLHNGNPIEAILGSPNPPVVSWIFPLGGEEFGDGSFTAQWIGDDTDGDPLTYALEFSPDGGQSWQPLAIDWPGTSFEVDAAHLPATTNGVLRVAISDGFHGAMAQTPGFFTITNHGPTAAILRPDGNSDFVGDQQIIFHADANDIEDGALDGTNVVWQSNLDGDLGTGAELFLNASNLKEGTHTITVGVQDSAGGTNSANVTIRVWKLAIPRLRIAPSGGQATISWPALLGTNWVLESSSDLAGGSWTNVTIAPFIGEEDQSVAVGITPDARYFRLRSE